MITVVAAPLKMLFKNRLCWRESPLVWGIRPLTQSPSAAWIQSEVDRVTMPRPQYFQNCRFVRKRCGGAADKLRVTMGTSRAARIGPKPGAVSKIRTMGCFLPLEGDRLLPASFAPATSKKSR